MNWYYYGMDEEEELDVNRLGLSSSSGNERQNITLSSHSGDEL